MFVLMALLTECSQPSAADQASIDRVTRAYYKALVEYDCVALKQTTLPESDACGRLPPKDQRQSMPVSVEFGDIAMIGETAATRELTVGGLACTVQLQRSSSGWLVADPPGLSCKE